MRRRKFISLVGGAAASWPFAVRAQRGRLPTIGFLGPDASDWRSWTDAFVVRLRELGWVERRTIAIEYRWSKARPERVADIAAEFVRLKVDVIVTHGGAVNTLKEGDSRYPHRLCNCRRSGGQWLRREPWRYPGGNVTGMSLEQNDIASKRIQLLRGVVPNLRRLAMLFNAHYPSSCAGDRRGSGCSSHATPRSRTTRNPARGGYCPRLRDVLGRSGCTLRRGRRSHFSPNRTPIITLALGARLPTIRNCDFVQAGALMSYGPNFPALFRRAAEDGR